MRKGSVYVTAGLGTATALDTASDSSGGRSPGGGKALVPALVIVWARHSDNQVGEAFFPGDRAAHVIGRRGEPAPSRLLPLRQRPGAGAFGPELSEPGMSRNQLHVRAQGEGVWVANIGRRQCRADGVELGEEPVYLRPGALLEVDRQLLLLCELRPATLAGQAPIAAFGEPDGLGLIGESPALYALRAQVLEAAGHMEHVLVHGPSGTGKEGLARAVHKLSARGGRPLVSRSVASMPEGLLDAELFGNVVGFPNPGMRAHGGLVGEANGSTLFLDEIGEIGHELQARLLRVMDEGEYTALGAARPQLADLRVVAATNREPSSLKHDLLARFVLRIRTLGLPEIRTDIPLIAKGILKEICEASPGLYGRFVPRAGADGLPRMSVELITALLNHPYRTHVRELRRLLHLSLAQSPGPWVEPCAELRGDGTRQTQGTASVIAPVAPAMPALPASWRELLTPEEARRLELQRALGFDTTACGDSPDYPTNRQNATLTLNILIAKALFAAGWQVEGAARLLFDLDETAPTPLGDVAWRRLSQRIHGLVRAQRQAPAGPHDHAEPPQELRRYGAAAVDLLRLRRALAQALLR